MINCQPLHGLQHKSSCGHCLLWFEKTWAKENVAMVSIECSRMCDDIIRNIRFTLPFSFLGLKGCHGDEKAFH